MVLVPGMTSVWGPGRRSENTCIGNGLDCVCVDSSTNVGHSRTKD